MFPQITTWVFRIFRFLKTSFWSPLHFIDLCVCHHKHEHNSKHKDDHLCWTTFPQSIIFFAIFVEQRFLKASFFSPSLLNSVSSKHHFDRHLCWTTSSNYLMTRINNTIFTYTTRVLCIIQTSFMHSYSIHFANPTQAGDSTDSHEIVRQTLSILLIYPV